MKRWSALGTFLAFLASAYAHAEVVVIVHPSNANTISDEDIKSLFLGKRKAFPNGDEAVPLNLLVDSDARNQFNVNALGKSESQLKAYWSQLLFTGKGVPPRELAITDAISEVASNVKAIAYVDAAQVNSSVKVIKTY